MGIGGDFRTFPDVIPTQGLELNNTRNSSAISIGIGKPNFKSGVPKLR